MKKSHIVLSVVIGVVVVLLAMWQVARQVQNKQHALWFDRSVAEVKALATQTNWMGETIATLQAYPDRNDDLGRHFISPNLILMSNGEWIIYRSATHKQGTQFPELFIGITSDQQWYYSTYHFCCQMIVLAADRQPSDLMAFKTKYCLRPYSGQPYSELRKTWPTSQSETDRR